MDDASLEQINNTKIINVNDKKIQNNKNITKFYEWVGAKVENKPDLLSWSVGDLFVVVDYTTFYEKEELLEDILRSRDKCYRC